MPRVSCATTRYHVDGADWFATFSHQYGINDHITRKVVVPIKTRDGIPVQHITTCTLKHVIGFDIVQAEAACSLRDHYDWRKGLITAFTRALAVAGIGVGTPSYNKHLHAFKREMEIKDYPPHNNAPAAPIPIVDGILVPVSQTVQ